MFIPILHEELRQWCPKRKNFSYNITSIPWTKKIDILMSGELPSEYVQQ